MHRLGTNLFLVALLFLLAADALPPFGRVHQQLKDAIDPLLDVTGLWQGDWGLFAPEVLKRSGRLSAEIRCANGETLVWQSPRLNTLPLTERFLRFREGEYYDTIRNDDSAGAWESLADYLARTEVARALPGTHATAITVWRHWWDVPPPGTGAPPQAEDRFAIFHKDYAP